MVRVKGSQFLLIAVAIATSLLPRELHGWAAVLATASSCPARLQGDSAQLETGSTVRSGITRKMVGDLSGRATQRAGRKG